MRHYVWEPGKSHLERLCSLLRQTTSFIIITLWNTILQKSGENVWHGNVFRGLNPKRSSPTNHKVASVISRSDGCFLLGCHIRQWCHQSVSWTLVRRFSEGLEGSPCSPKIQLVAHSQHVAEEREIVGHKAWVSSSSFQNSQELMEC